MALYAQKANIVTGITEEQIDKFVADGYKIIDESGRIIRETAPDNIPALKEAYIQNIAEINALKAENARLKDELARAAKILENQKSVATADVAEKPKRTRARKTVEEE